MPNLIRLIALSCVISSLGISATLNFEGAFQAALSKEPNAIKKTETAAADEKVSQAFGQVLPRLTLNGSYTRQDSPVTATASLLSSDQWFARFTVNQPIFHGLSEFAGYHSLQAKHKSAAFTESAYRLTLYSTVASAYYGLLSAEKDLEDVKTLLELTAKRVTDIKERVRIGRSRKGDLLSAQAQSLTLEAEVLSSTHLCDDARELFKLTTGLDGTSQLQDDGALPPEFKTGLPELLKELDKRPDIQSAKEEHQAADEGVSAAFGTHLPQIDFAANYYLKRSGILENTKWDFGIIATIPIFNGGVTQATVRENIEIRKAKELTLAYTRRSAEKDLKTSFEGYRSLLEQNRAYEKAYELADANYKEQNKDYRNGLVTNLDVLTAMNSLQETKRSKDKTFYQAKAAYRQLLAATGKIP